jgi:hypothetical protein
MAYKVNSFEYVPAYGGDSGLIVKFQEDDSQTFVKGDLVFRQASGEIQVCGADPASILGIAMSPATNVTSAHTYIPVQVIRSGDVFTAHNIAAQTFALADAGDSFEIVRTAAGNWEIDSTQAANTTRVLILQSMEFDSEGNLQATAGGPVMCRFLAVAGTTVDILQYEADGT